MQAFLDRINNLTNTLKGLLPMKAEDKSRLDKKIRLEFNFNSNHIEGNTLTYGETELLLIFDKTTGNHELREYEEMKAHDVVFEIVKEWAGDKERNLSEAEIKNLHKTLLVRAFWKEAITPDGQSTRRLIEVGNYKKYPNSVRLQNGEIFDYASVDETPVLMGELIDWYKKEEQKGELHPVVLAALLHYKFVRIHPFDDGNGRLSRLLMNYVLLKHDLPPVIIKSADKKAYLFALNQADVGDMDAFIGYVGEQLIWSLELQINAAKGKLIDEIGDLDKKIYLLKAKLGEDPNTTIHFTYGNESIKAVVNNIVIPISKAWERRLKNFDTLFINRAAILRTERKAYPTKFFDEQFEQVCSNFLSSNPAANQIKYISVYCTGTGLRNIINDISINGGEFNIRLLENSFEINYTRGERFINKLYHETISDLEVERIAETLGNFLYDNVEQSIEAHKK